MPIAVHGGYNNTLLVPLRGGWQLAGPQAHPCVAESLPFFTNRAYNVMVSLNWKEIDVILSEWNMTGAKIQQVLQPTHHELYIEVYGPTHASHEHDEHAPPAIQRIYISLVNTMVRMHTIPHRMKKPKTAQRFQQLLQSKLIGRYITNIEHVNHDRIVRITCEYSQHKLEALSTDAEHLHATVYVYCKLWSNQANIILTDEHNVIFDLAFRRPHQSLMPGKTFAMPEPSARTNAHTQIRSYDASAYTSFNEYCHQYYTQQLHTHQQEKKTKKMNMALQKQMLAVTSKLRTITQQIEDNSKYQELEHIGNIILAHAHSIHHDDTILHSTIETEDGATENIAIPLRKDMTPTENAQRYFQQAKKAKKSLAQLHDMQSSLQDTREELAHIEANIAEHIPLTAKQLQLLQLQADVRTARKDTQTAKEIKLYFHDKDYLIMVGRSAKENDILLRKYVKGNDMWLHIRGYSGAYVFIRAPKNKTIPLAMLEQCGQIAALYSKAKNETYADIYYAQVKHVKKVKNALGMVTPLRNKNLQIKIDAERTKKYLQQFNTS